MSQRKTIRPVTLRRVIETCSLAEKSETLDIEAISQKLRVSFSRGKEVLQEVERMGLLRQFGESYEANRRTSEFLGYFENEKWDKIHEYFLKNYSFYRDFISLLENHIKGTKGLLMEEIKEKTNDYASLNQTAIEVLSDWCDRLGIIQRHLYSKRLYLVMNERIDREAFRTSLSRCYRELSFSQGRRGVFVEIPKIREDTCEQLKITRGVFDEMLRQTYLENIGRIELSGAPITTLAKKSLLSERKMKPEGKKAVLSPKFELERKREGLVVGRKVYYYLAIHEDI